MKSSMSGFDLAKIVIVMGLWLYIVADSLSADISPTPVLFLSHPYPQLCNFTATYSRLYRIFRETDNLKI